MRRARRLTRFAAAIATIALTGATSAAGCDGKVDKETNEGPPNGSSQILERLTQSSIDQIDIVLAIDNSRSMADKQQILELAIPDLVRALVNPLCLDKNGAPAPMQPTGPLDPCPVAGTKREIDPIVDIHIGIISSSIGGHGADACPDQDNTTCAPSPNFSNNDKGRLVARLNECGGGDAPT
ncbi:MAG TPA: hypothetical protein VK459_21515, partial [Polyangiaceae bacterium]|nr:hypothetical protein [Polyangiaceae bacterium]